MKHLNPLPALALLVIVDPAPLQARQSADEWSIEESRAPSTMPLRFTATEGTWMNVDVSPDGGSVVFDLLGHIYEMPVTGGDATALTTGRSWNTLPRYSPDGTRIAFTSDRSGTEDIWILHRGTDSLENVTTLPSPVFQATWSGRETGSTRRPWGRTPGPGPCASTSSESSRKSPQA